MTVPEILAEIDAQRSDTLRAQNAKRRDVHAVRMGVLRGLAKKTKKDHELAQALWETGVVEARLLSTLICRPKEFSAEELDAMAHQVEHPQLLHWIVAYVFKVSKHAEELRLRWMGSPHEFVAGAGWALTVVRIQKKPEGLDLTALMDEIEADMVDAVERKQWSGVCGRRVDRRPLVLPETSWRSLFLGEPLGTP